MTLSRNARRRLVFYGSIVAAIGGAALYCSAMPGHSYVGSPPLDARESRYEPVLRAHVTALAAGIGERNTRVPTKLAAAAGYVESVLANAGYVVHRHAYVVDRTRSETLDVDLVGSDSAVSGEVVVVGAHYDSATSAPGADDNASGSAAVLALAAVFAGHPARRTLRFALFPNEEPPYFATESMGSLVYARELAARGDRIVAMLSLESLGCFADAPGSQQYPSVVGVLYPDRGDFIAFVGDLGSRSLVRDAVRVFRANAHVASEGGALPRAIPGIDWSDHRSFWAIGAPALMVTDTATFRNANYHRASDTVETVDYARLAKVVAGVEDVVRDLATR